MILIALHYIHSKNIYHRDLKPANILVDQLKGTLDILRISDFGISKNADLRKTRRTATMKGDTTPAYIAPEVINGMDETSKVDIWALGVMLYEMVNSLKHPFPSESSFKMMAMIRE